MAESGPEFDVVVVGAGAAGIAAARRLGLARLKIMVVEARDRLGGRAVTTRNFPGLALDLGCEWLHCADRNPWTGVARQLGFALDREPPNWGSRVAWRQGKAADADWQKTREAQ